MQSLSETVAAFRAGLMTREAFWRKMQTRHLGLREYQELLGGELLGIVIGAEELRVVTREGRTMVWLPEDLRSPPSVLVNHGAYEPQESALLLEAGQGAEVVFDVGANAGFYSLHWVSRLRPGGIIHAFEPVPSTYATLLRNVALNGLEKTVRTHEFALGDETKTATFFVPDVSGSVAASLRNLHPEETSVEVTVRIETLDRFSTAESIARLDLMKIDVEGAELAVLKGGLQTIVKCKPLLFMELLRKWAAPFGYHPNDVIALLGGMGYRCCAVSAGGLKAFAEMTDETPETNFFFAHPERHGDWLAAHGL